MGTAGAGATSVRLAVLGPLRLTVDGASVDVPGRRRRALLALLAMAGGRSVSVETIIDALWQDDAPDTAAQAVQSHVSRLRRTLGPAADRLQRVGGGYALRLSPEDLDAAEVRRAAAVVRRQLRANPATAAREAAAALTRWRGRALAEFTEVPPLLVDAVALDELHATLRDDELEARLALGEGSVADTVAAVAAEPLRERTVSLLVRALAAEDRTAEAMQAAAAYRRRLADETGLDPGAGFALLEQEVAAGALAPAARPRPLPARFTVARPRGPLIGRDHDREELSRLLEQNSAVTVTGPGGVGKTRLVLDVAAEMADRGVDTVLVPLAAVTEPDRVPEEVASAAALRIDADRSVGSVAAALAGQRLLLVLDNCEHVVAACRDLVTVLQARAPDVRVLATSRTTLHVPAEYVMRLQPLPLPRRSTATSGAAGRLQELARQPAVHALLEHAQRRRGEAFTLTADNVDALIEIIRRLDGLPLAIELAAGQLAVLPVGALHDRLGRALDLLAVERPTEQTRHSTLRMTIAWSYELLGSEEQSLLRALAPFPGGVDLDVIELLAQEAGFGTDPLVLLSRLVDASLVAVDQQHTTARYTLLDTVRAFLVDELDGRGERGTAERRFLRWAEQTAEELRQGLRSAHEAVADRRLRLELANLRAARDLARRNGDLDLRIAITLAVHEAAVYRDISELWAWSRELAADPSLSGHRQETAVLGSAAESSWLLGDLEEAERLARQGLRVAEESGAEETLTRRSWSALAVVALFRADFDTSRARWLRAASLGDDPSPQLATAAMASGYAGDRESAAQLLAQAREANERVPSVGNRAYNHYAAGEIAVEPQRAVREYTVARELARSCGATFVEGVATVGLASVLTTTGDVTEAAGGFLMLLDYWPVTGNQTQLWTTVRNAALLLLDVGRVETAALLLASADAAGSASSVGGASGSRVTLASERLQELMGPSGLAAVRARAGTLDVADVLRLAREELQRVASEKTGALTPAARSTPGSGTGP